ncbi:MAG TPA: cell wall-binding protein [Candidatus Hungatella pullicola]|nr:cell wall-binding protein [Candidatus Hungatella pullicola]
MKKHVKLMAVLSVAGFMAAAAPGLAAPGTAFAPLAASSGWVEENGSWKYYEDGDYYLTDTWKKRGDNWYYLNEDGVVATNMQIDEYYVDETGKRVSSQWVSVENEEYWDSPDAAEIHWYYYGANGKYISSKFQDIDGQRYYFNDEGHMVTGRYSIDGSTYYFGDENDGAMKKGWVLLASEDEEMDMESYWHYFEPSGKMVENQVDKKIAGFYYTFEDGMMQTGWYKLPEETTATASDAAANESLDSASGYQYYDPESGKRASGWKTIEGIEGLSEEGELYTFYFKNGKPYYGEDGLKLFTIDSKKYAFNAKGEMQTGLKELEVSEGTTAVYYFGTDGIMKTGRQVIYDEDLGENKNWYFHTDGSKKGQGYHGIRENILYIRGMRQEADPDLKVEPKELDGVSYLINTSGHIQKASTSSKSASRPELGAGYKDYQDYNDTVWVVDTKGRIQ